MPLKLPPVLLLGALLQAADEELHDTKQDEDNNKDADEPRELLADKGDDVVMPLVGKDTGKALFLRRFLQGLGQKAHDTGISLSLWSSSRMQELQTWMQSSDGEGRGPYGDNTGCLGRSGIVGSSLWSNGSWTASGLYTSSATSFEDRYQLSANGWNDADERDGSVFFAGYLECADGGAAGPFAEL